MNQQTINNNHNQYYETQYIPYYGMCSPTPIMIPMPPPPVSIMQIPEGEWTSLYVPMIPNDMLLCGYEFKAMHLQDFIENKLQIGKVRRIDFVDRDDLIQFNEENPIQAAFIHMLCWYDNYNAHMLRNALNTKGEMRQRGFHNGREMLKFTGKETQTENYFRYFVFKINHKPIPDADGKLNIHQLAALKTKHEAELVEAHAEVERLKQEIENMKSVETNAPTSSSTHGEQKPFCVMEKTMYDSFSKSSFE